MKIRPYKDWGFLIPERVRGNKTLLYRRGLILSRTGFSRMCRYAGLYHLPLGTGPGDGMLSDRTTNYVVGSATVPEAVPPETLAAVPVAVIDTGFPAM